MSSAVLSEAHGITGRGVRGHAHTYAHTHPKRTNACAPLPRLRCAGTTQQTQRTRQRPPRSSRSGAASVHPTPRGGACARSFSSRPCSLAAQWTSAKRNRGTRCTHTHTHTHTSNEACLSRGAARLLLSFSLDCKCMLPLLLFLFCRQPRSESLQAHKVLPRQEAHTGHAPIGAVQRRK